MAISPRPVFGPEPIHRRSLQIFTRETATVRSAPDISTALSCALCASKWFFASVSGSPVCSAMRAVARAPKPSGVLMPVPTAVPPSASCARRGSAASTRSIPKRIWAA